MFEQVIETLTNQTIDPKLGRLAQELAHHYHPEKIEEFCWETFRDWQSTSTAVLSTVARYSQYVDELPIVLEMFTHRLKQPTGKHLNEEYFLGTLLGLVKGALWLDEHWTWQPTKFETDFLPTFVEILIGPIMEELERNQSLAADFPATKYKLYRGEFTNSFKAYVRGDAIKRSASQFTRSDRKVTRMFAVQGGINLLGDNLLNRTKDAPTAITDFFVDQLTYAIFGSLSPQGRAISMRDYQNRILEAVMAAHPTGPIATAIAP